jgi:hypothetical protein
VADSGHPARPDPDRRGLPSGVAAPHDRRRSPRDQDRRRPAAAGRGGPGGAGRQGRAIARHYPEVGLRQYTDLDVVVRPDEMGPARAALAGPPAGHYPVESSPTCLLRGTASVPVRKSQSRQRRPLPSGDRGMRLSPRRRPGHRWLVRSFDTSPRRHLGRLLGSPCPPGAGRCEALNDSVLGDRGRGRWNLAVSDPSCPPVQTGHHGRLSDLAVVHE